MIKNLLLRGLPALALSALPLLATAAPASADGPASAVTRPAALETACLFEGIDRIPAAAESRDGYVRTAFKHWNAGAIADDGCNTRAEVILAEAVEQPEVAPGCKLTGGRWFSPYVDTWVAAASGLDVDHLVPLAESWDSGASAWTAKRREAYANDLATPTSLIAVTAKSNRAKADKDPAEWLPPTATYHCTYVTSWVETKLRGSLTADDREREALLGLAEDCPRATVTLRDRRLRHHEVDAPLPTGERPGGARSGSASPRRHDGPPWAARHRRALPGGPSEPAPRPR